jgi:membrane protein implicated in regulation of membrane protease activity
MVGVIPAALLVWFGSALAVAGSTGGVLLVLLIGSAASALGVYIFFRFVSPRALALVKEDKVKK